MFEKLSEVAMKLYNDNNNSTIKGGKSSNSSISSNRRRKLHTRMKRSEQSSEGFITSNDSFCISDPLSVSSISTQKS